MPVVKTVDKSGRIYLGKALAGREFIVENLPGGDILLKRTSRVSRAVKKRDR